MITLNSDNVIARTHSIMGGNWRHLRSMEWNNVMIWQVGMQCVRMSVNLWEYMNTNDTSEAGRIGVAWRCVIMMNLNYWIYMYMLKYTCIVWIQNYKQTTWNIQWFGFIFLYIYIIKYIFPAWNVHRLALTVKIANIWCNK